MCLFRAFSPPPHVASFQKSNIPVYCTPFSVLLLLLYTLYTVCRNDTSHLDPNPVPKVPSPVPANVKSSE